MKMRMLIIAACLVYLPLLSNANAVTSQHNLSPKSVLAPLANIKHDHDLVMVYGGEDICPKQLSTRFVV